jgi:hypothetical protein
MKRRGLTLNLIVDSGGDTEDNHEQSRQRTDDDQQKDDHQSGPNDTLYEVHRITLLDAAPCALAIV